MTIQTLDNPSMISSLVIASSPIYLPESPIRASSRDYGFDLDEDELVPLISSSSIQSTPEVTADEFEPRYIWFVS